MNVTLTITDLNTIHTALLSQIWNLNAKLQDKTQKHTHETIRAMVKDARSALVPIQEAIFSTFSPKEQEELKKLQALSIHRKGA